MSWIAVGVTVGSALFGSSQAKRAAKAKEAGYNEAGGIVKGAYADANNYLAPRAQQEQAAIARENSLLGLAGGDGSDPTETLRNTPGYQFQLNQGSEAVARQRSATGGLASGNTLIALQEYGQGLADQTFNNYLAQIGGVAGQGVDAMQSGMAINQGNTLANLRLGAAGAKAGGIEDSANALIGGASSVGSMFGASRGASSIRQPQQYTNAMIQNPGYGVRSQQYMPAPGPYARYAYG